MTVDDARNRISELEAQVELARQAIRNWKANQPEYADYRELLLDESGFDCGLSHGPDVPDEFDASLSTAEGSLIRFGQECAADPVIRPFLRPWMLDLCGTTRGAGDLSSALVALQEDDREAFHQATGGDLMANVRNYLETELGLWVPDSGGGTGSWHLGVYLTDDELRLALPLIRSRFAKPIAARLLVPRLKFWGWRFRERDDE